MRRIFSIIFLSILLTSSCCCGTSAEKVDATKGVVLSTEKIILPGSIDKESDDPYKHGLELHITKFMYEGHDYMYIFNIDLEDIIDGDNPYQVLHDPNCRKCNEKSSGSTLSNYQSMFDW